MEALSGTQASHWTPGCVQRKYRADAIKAHIRDVYSDVKR